MNDERSAFFFIFCFLFGIIHGLICSACDWSMKKRLATGVVMIAVDLLVFLLLKGLIK